MIEIPDNLNAEKFMAFVKPTTKDECWTWLGGHNSDGRPCYNCMGKMYLASRIIYALLNGNTDLFILHKCNNKACVNPNHLYAGTIKQNKEDMIRAGRQWRKFSVDVQRDIVRMRSEGHGFAHIAYKHSMPKASAHRIYVRAVKEGLV